MKSLFWILTLAGVPLLLLFAAIAGGAGLLLGLGAVESGGSNAISEAAYQGGGPGSSTPKGGTLSYIGVARLAQAAGIPKDQLATAVAIAMAESSLNTGAINYNTNGSVDRGLWQINSIHTTWNTNQEFDPAYNARAMANISNNGSNWAPWSTYDSGAYKQYLPAAQRAVDQATIGTSL